ncbi:hypothetical protein LTR56_019436 [Elasticomyces elasticus]|nr:hypothetical protein LTR56_019436 [Elasticomyces elasticus]KAK3635863.1 hypothetical protein LTR22_018998 [Elasticomyces elasticus]KAK4907332.1 hypothetical protein LTR49_023658 [Elasticomyces elasticus]KAK5747741.1 hypothetical protein LTS12_022183 [Elasticomyces elasticus]
MARPHEGDLQQETMQKPPEGQQARGEQGDTATEPSLHASFGNDNAADARAKLPQPLPIIVHRAEETDDEAASTVAESEEYLNVSIPMSSPGITTFAYQRALQNRIKEAKLLPRGDFDTRIWKPTFIHDCLMLPGSLANLLGKLDAEQLIHRMTPALLPGFHPYVHADTLQPCILQSPNMQDYVQGIVVFGLGAESKKIIHDHYRSHCRRVKVEVEIDVSVALAPANRVFPGELWRLQRSKVPCHVYLWSNAGSGDAMFRTQAQRWTIDDYLGGNLEPAQVLNIVEGWQDVQLGDLDSDADEVEERGVTHNGAGSAERELVCTGGSNAEFAARCDMSFTGW